jgi:signal transduction histidine kinase
VDGNHVVLRRGNRLEVRSADSLLDPTLEDPDVALAVVPAATPGAVTFAPPLESLAVLARSRDRGGGSLAIALFAGVAAYVLGAALLVVALVRSVRTERQRSDFVASVSHEMKTPIASVRALAELLADGAASDPERARSYAERIGWEMERLGATVRNVLDAARIERGGALPLCSPSGRSIPPASSKRPWTSTPPTSSAAASACGRTSAAPGRRSTSTRRRSAAWSRT